MYPNDWTERDKKRFKWFYCKLIYAPFALAGMIYCIFLSIDYPAEASLIAFPIMVIYLFLYTMRHHA